MLVPSKDQYLAQTGGNRPMAVYRDVLADVETPVSAYWKLAHDQTYSFLLESVTGGEQLARYSILGIRPKLVLRSKDGNVTRFRNHEVEQEVLATGQDPLDLLKEAMLQDIPIHVPGLPSFAGGAVGLLSYDIVRYFENLPNTTQDDLKVDDMAMMLADTVVVFDHAKNIIRVTAMTDGTSASYDEAVEEINQLEKEMIEGFDSPLEWFMN